MIMNESTMPFFLFVMSINEFVIEGTILANSKKLKKKWQHG